MHTFYFKFSFQLGLKCSERGQKQRINVTLPKENDKHSVHSFWMWLHKEETKKEYLKRHKGQVINQHNKIVYFLVKMTQT